MILTEVLHFQNLFDDLKKEMREKREHGMLEAEIKEWMEALDEMWSGFIHILVESESLMKSITRLRRE